MGEVIAIKDKAFSSKDVDIFSTYEIVRVVEFFLLQAHSWVVSHHWDFWDLAFSKKHWEWISTTVLSNAFLHFYLAISEIEIEDVLFRSSVISSIVP